MVTHVEGLVVDPYQANSSVDFLIVRLAPLTREQFISVRLGSSLRDRNRPSPQRDLEGIDWVRLLHFRSIVRPCIPWFKRLLNLIHHIFY